LRLRGLTRLVMRLLRANRQRNIVLGSVIAVAVFGALLLENVGQTIVDQLEFEAQRRHGTAQITLPGRVASDADSRRLTLAGGGGWITGEQADRIAEILQSESVRVRPRVQADAILVSDGQFATVRVLSSAGTEVQDSDPGVLQSLLIGYAPVTPGDEPGAGFVDLGGDGGPWTDGRPWIQDRDVQDMVWVNGDKLMHVLRNAGVAPTDAVGNVLLIQSDSPDDRSPAVIAYNAAELLATKFPEVVVQSRLDLAGRSERISAVNITSLLSLALLLPAAAAIVGSILVTGESRSDELILLTTMGFDTPTVRALMVREVFLVAAGATLLALVVAGIVTAAAPSLSLSLRSIVRSAGLGTFIPPGLTFLTARRLLSRGIHERLAEFRR